MNWTYKYRPLSTNEIVGQENAVKELIRFIKGNNPVIVYGSVGCGKTCSVYAVAQELGYEVLEVNASDQRNKEQIEQVIGNAAKQKSLFTKGRIILVDEIDGISGNEDRGGVQSLAKIIQDTAHPIVMVANDPYSKKLADLRKQCELIEFSRLDYPSIYEVLKKICKKENVEFDDLALKELARLADGDLRAAINDLQSICEDKNKLTQEDLDFIGLREKEQEITNALRLIFKSKDPKIVRQVFDNVPIDLDECFLWLDENLPFEYDGEDLANAYSCLSKADVFKGRIHRRQHWRYLVYQNDFMTAGVALAKKEKTSGFTKLRRSQRILKLWQAKMRNAKKMSISTKIAENSHSSTAKIVKDVFHFAKNYIAKNKEIIEELKLSSDEIEWITKKGS
ncbi:MAG: replication factor C large subunit [Candidatus Woesearchaeota archaeon]|nr:MAG: replication factor C large subunit [Candidatus Woesearchaeota archaeon]